MLYNISKVTHNNREVNQEEEDVGVEAGNVLLLLISQYVHACTL